MQRMYLSPGLQALFEILRVFVLLFDDAYQVHPAAQDARRGRLQPSQGGISHGGEGLNQFLLIVQSLRRTLQQCVQCHQLAGTLQQVAVQAEDLRHVAVILSLYRQGAVRPRRGFHQLQRQFQVMTGYLQLRLQHAATQIQLAG